VPDLLQCTNEPNVSVPEMANILIERTQNSNWVVVFKALITVHNLMNYGNEVSCHYFVVLTECELNADHFAHENYFLKVIKPKIILWFVISLCQNAQQIRTK